MIEKIKEFIGYRISESKNRFPYKICDIQNYISKNKETKILFKCHTTKNINTANLKTLNDPNIIDKFSSHDSAIIGFLTCFEIIFQNEIVPDNIMNIFVQHIKGYLNEK